MRYAGYFGYGGFGEPAPLVCNNARIPPLATIRPFTNNKIFGTCQSRGVFGITDPGAVIRAAVTRALEMLDHTIGDLVNARTRVCAGEAPASVLDAVTLDFLRNRLSVCVDDIRVWTAGTFVNRSVAEVIRRLTRVRNLIASNVITYVCNGPECESGDWAYVLIDPTCQRTEPTIVRLCRLFWIPATGVSAADHAEFQAQVIIHEASHLYHCTADATGSTIGVAECMRQFVAANNGSPQDADFATRCPGSTRCAPAPGGVSGLSGYGYSGGYGGFGFAAPPRLRKLSTVIRSQNAVRLKQPVRR
jgi:hypothetical protein